MRLLFALLISVLVFSSAAYSVRPEDELVAAIRRKEIELAKQIFAAHFIHPDTEVPKADNGDPRPGQTILWLAAFFQQWDLLGQMFDRFSPNLNVNASPTAGPQAGKTVVWLMLQDEQSIKHLEQYFQGGRINLDAAPESDPGMTVFWIAAFVASWDLIEQNFDVANLEATPRIGPDAGVTIFNLALGENGYLGCEKVVSRLLEYNPEYFDEVDDLEIFTDLALHGEWGGIKAVIDRILDANSRIGTNLMRWLNIEAQSDLARKIIGHPNVDINGFGIVNFLEHEFVENQECPPLGYLFIVRCMNRDIPGANLADRLENPIPSVGWSLEQGIDHVSSLFERAALALPQAATTSSSTFNLLPSEISIQIALKVVVKDKNIAQIPGRELELLLRRFCRLALDPAFDIIACSVLQNLRAANPNGLEGYRRLIKTAAEAMVDNNPNGVELTQAGRVRIVSILTAAFTMMRQPLLPLTMPPLDAPAPPTEEAPKRPREEAGDDEQRVTRHRPDDEEAQVNIAEVTQAVIAAQPGLDWREINAEVEEILGRPNNNNEVLGGIPAISFL